MQKTIPAEASSAVTVRSAVHKRMSSSGYPQCRLAAWAISGSAAASPARARRMCAVTTIMPVSRWLVTAPPFDQPRLRELRQVIADRVPGRLELDEDVCVGPQLRIAIEQAGRDLETRGAGLRIGDWRTAAAAEEHAIRGWSLDDRRVVGFDQLRAARQSEVLAANSEPGGERRPRRLAATAAVTELERPDGALDLEPHASAQAAAGDHRCIHAYRRRWRSSNAVYERGSDERNITTKTPRSPRRARLCAPH